MRYLTTAMNMDEYEDYIYEIPDTSTYKQITPEN